MEHTLLYSIQTTTASRQLLLSIITPYYCIAVYIMTGRFYQPQMRIACRGCDRRGYYYLGGFTKEAPPFFVLSHFNSLPYIHTPSRGRALLLIE